MMTKQMMFTQLLITKYLFSTVSLRLPSGFMYALTAWSTQIKLYIYNDSMI